jgi:CRP/FNR family transcriptional regulator, cyclic AMP receptor protein
MLIATAMVPRQYPHRGAIALSGDPSEHLFLVIDGLASADLFSVDGQYAQLAGYGPGELFGAYPDATTHRADITAQGGLDALLIETKVMAGLAREHGAIALGIAQIMARQLDLTLDRMAARIGLSATGRCYRALLQRSDSDGWIKPAPVLSALAIGVNTTRETASRALANLVRRGIVERSDVGLRIVSRRMLEDMVI